MDRDSIVMVSVADARSDATRDRRKFALRIFETRMRVSGRPMYADGGAMLR
jgi:hypothetical protein